MGELIATEYLIDNRNPDKPVYIKARNIAPDGNPVSWAVVCRDMCMSYDGEFDMEPSPSNRDDEYLKNNRFDSVAMAWTRYSLFYDD